MEFKESLAVLDQLEQEYVNNNNNNNNNNNDILCVVRVHQVFVERRDLKDKLDCKA